MNTDVLVLIVEHLDADGLRRLASTCRHFYLIVRDFGWSIFLRNNHRHSLTLHCSRSRWSPLAQVRFNTITDSAWSRASFVARPLIRPWYGYRQPTIALSISTLLVAAGCSLYHYSVQDTRDGSPSRIVFERTCTFAPHLTAVAFLPDLGQDRTAFLGLEDGSVQRVCLPPQGERRIDAKRMCQDVLHRHGTDIVQSISCASRSLLSLSQSGSVFLSHLTSGAAASSTSSINLGTRSWASHLCTSSSSPYAVFGTSSHAPLCLHYILPDGLSSSPSINLQSPNNRPSAVYGIASAPPSSPLGPSEQIIVSGWYDGSVHIYDLRVSGSNSLSSSAPTLLPVLSLNDPLSPEPIYSISCGGGNASFVAAGTARHSVISFWDVRQPSKGWNAYAPGNDQSPVYSTVLESSRLFGVTQSRPFVYDFGPGVTKDTYPPIFPTRTNGRREDRLILENNGIGYSVVTCQHSWPKTIIE